MSTKSAEGSLNGEFSRLVQETLEMWHVPGVAVAVVDGDKTWARGYGIASFPSTPVTPSTLFYTGSTTKAFTAAILSLLVDDAEKYPHVHWDTPISQLIRDDFVLEDEYATNHVTIEDALSHRTGMPRHDQAYGHGGEKPAPVREIVRSMRSLSLTAELRTKYQYCNLMYITASHLVETLTGEWMGDLMARWIWKPLGMMTTFFSLEDAKKSKQELARGYYFEEGKYHPVEWMSVDETPGAGGIISNVLDYAKWARALMNQEEGVPLSKVGYEEIWRPRTLVPSEEPYTGPRAYALGWLTGVYHGHRFFEHSGGMNAFGTEFVLFPDLQFSVIIFGNTAGTSNFVEQALAFYLIDEKLNVPVTQRFDCNKRNLTRVEEEKEKVRNARDLFYPSVPNPVLPPTVPLADYAGTYQHPGYQTITIYLDASDSKLRADRQEFTWPEQLTFEHISGDYFLATAMHQGGFGALYPNMYAAQFRIGADGRPCAFGMTWEKEMKGKKIWFRRV